MEPKATKTRIPLELSKKKEELELLIATVSKLCLTVSASKI